MFARDRWVNRPGGVEGSVGGEGHDGKKGLEDYDNAAT